MITLEMTPEVAISLLHLICSEEQKYGQQYVPVRIEHLRALLPQIDAQLEEHYQIEKDATT